MSEYEVVNNYLLFRQLDSDSIGINYRVGEVQDRKPIKHHLLTEVYPFLSENKDVWKRVKILMEGIKKSNIPNLYSPEHIIKEEDKALLVFPLLKGQTFEKVLDDSAKKDLPINFDLTLSIAIAIADLIDIGSSIVVSGEKSFHGFLTPDNVIVDYDGKILLKNYGIYPYLNRSDDIYNEMVKKYGSWLAPEFIRREKLVPQTDVYYLGYIIYRILTGEYFSYSEGEDFDTKFSNISFTHHIPSSDTDFLTNIITFFKKTLAPDPSQRFAHMKEFKDYIALNFHIEELSSVTFNLAYFMNSLYLETMEEEKTVMDKELTYVIPEPKVEKVVPESRGNDHLAEDILAGLEEHEKKSKMKIVIPVAAVILIAVIAVFLYLQNVKDAEQKRELEAIRQEVARKQAEQEQKDREERDFLKKQLEALQKSQTADEAEKKANADAQSKLQAKLKEMEDLRKKEEEERETEKKRQEALSQQQQLEEAKKEKDRLAKIEAARKLKEQEDLLKKMNAVKEGDLVPLPEVSVEPEKIDGKIPKMPANIKRKYDGTQTIIASILIDHNGDVTNVNIVGRVQPDIKDTVEKALMKWKYKPALKNNVRVKVYKSVSFSIEL